MAAIGAAARRARSVDPHVRVLYCVCCPLRLLCCAFVGTVCTHGGAKRDDVTWRQGPVGVPWRQLPARLLMHASHGHDKGMMRA